MYLNDIGQPLILAPNKTYGPYEQHNGPLLLSAAALKPHTVPMDWFGSVIGSEQDIHQLQRIFPEKYSNCDFHILKPNEATEVVYEKTRITVTLIPTPLPPGAGSGKKPTLFYLEDEDSRVLIADNVPDHLDFLPKASKNFHLGLNQGIDVMYIDDLHFGSGETLSETDKENLYALVQLMRPKHIYGLRQENNLPKWLLDLCVQRDLYARELF